MQESKNGSPLEWVDAVWRLNSPTIYKLCEARCKSTDDAKDLFQTVALKFCQNAEKLTDRQSALPWLLAVLRTSFCDMVAEKHSTYTFSALKMDDSILISECASRYTDVERDDDFGHFEKLLAELNPLENLIVEMSFIGGMSSNEISTVVGLSANAIRKRKHFALMKMRKKLEESL